MPQIDSLALVSFPRKLKDWPGLSILERTYYTWNHIYKIPDDAQVLNQFQLIQTNRGRPVSKVLNITLIDLRTKEFEKKKRLTK